ncbi:Hint domain-containing protein [Shimia sp. W99]
MATISFFARGDSNTANNSYLNAENTNSVPTTEITFSSGTSGNLKLQPNGGLPDPNTTVIINGVEMSFTVEFSGTLPNSNKLKNVNGEDLRGEPIVVITTEDGQRLFLFPNGVSQATMDAFPNGAHDLNGWSDVVSIPICFVRGTLIDTPRGPVPVERLIIGDRVTTEAGGSAEIRWIAERRMSQADLLLEPQYRPICIRAGQLGKGMPRRDLWVSPQHRILFRGWQAEILFREAAVLFPAVSFARFGGQVADPAGGVDYFHLMFEQHEVIMAEGLGAESLYPGDQAIASLTPAARARMARAFSHLEGDWSEYGPLARPCLTRWEGETLLECAGFGDRGGASRQASGGRWQAVA